MANIKKLPKVLFYSCHHKGNKMKLYRDITIRVYGEKHCKVVDKLRKNGVNITELLTQAIEKKAKAINDYQIQK